MRLIVSGDATFAEGWQKGYQATEPLTRVLWPETRLGKHFYADFFPALDEKIKTPVAFALLAPYGWTGERCDWDYRVLPEYGWTPVAWCESTHLDKTFVQLYMRDLRSQNPSAAVRPPSSNKDGCVPYSGKIVGALPYLGCSSILSDYVEPRMKVALPTPHMFVPTWDSRVSASGVKLFHPKGLPSEQCLHFVRVARPALFATLRMLKKEGFRPIFLTKWNSYWIRGKEGLGDKKLCRY